MKLSPCQRCCQKVAASRLSAAPNLTVLGALAAEVTARAVLNAVRAAQGLHGPGLPDLPSANDLGLG